MKDKTDLKNEGIVLHKGEAGLNTQTLKTGQYGPVLFFFAYKS
jgi:hypothetical protein